MKHKKYIALILLLGTPNINAADVQLCNGKENLCDRPYNKIAQISVHNATSNTKRGFIVPNINPCTKEQCRGTSCVTLPDVCDYDTGINPVANQHWDLGDFLNSGLRSFNISIHPIAPTNTPWIAHIPEQPNITEQIKDIVQQKVPTILQAKVTYFIDKTIKGNIWEIDTTNVKLLDVLIQLKSFLDASANEVITLILNIFNLHNGTMLQQLKDNFKTSGINQYIFVPNLSQPWPTLKQMIAANKRLVLFVDQDIQEQGFTNISNVGFSNKATFKTVDELQADDCQDAKDHQAFSNPNSVCIMNHFITNPFAGSEQDAEKINQYPILMGHVTKCSTFLSTAARRTIYPNFILLAFVDEQLSDLQKAVDELNSKTW